MIATIWGIGGCIGNHDGVDQKHRFSNYIKEIYAGTDLFKENDFVFDYDFDLKNDRLT